MGLLWIDLSPKFRKRRIIPKNRLYKDLWLTVWRTDKMTGDETEFICTHLDTVGPQIHFPLYFHVKCSTGRIAKLSSCKNYRHAQIAHEISWNSIHETSQNLIPINLIGPSQNLKQMKQMNKKHQISNYPFIIFTTVNYP